MNQSPSSLREDALAIWRAAVDAVRADRLVRENVRVDNSTLHIGEHAVDLNGVERIEVVGAGKAGATMAAGLEQALGEQVMREKRLSGWINVPDNCTEAALSHIHLHGARPAGVNEPRPEGVAGAEEILHRAGSLSQDDLCLCLISGGGSALLPAPAEGITLEDKQAVTRHLSSAGANIQQLNTVRKNLSRIKGGGLARACRAGRLYALIISDVLGDPLDMIASGPTVADPSTAEDALRVLEEFGAREAGVSQAVFDCLANREKSAGSIAGNVVNLVIGNNAVAVDAAGQEAVRRGYSPAMTSATKCEGQAEDVGRRLAEMALKMRAESGPDCLISGGEPVVRLVDSERRGLGGRNQQLVLAALLRVLQDEAAPSLENMVLLSGGTDGEDGPTDAAGAVADEQLIERLRKRSLDPDDSLARNDAYHFFEPLEGLIKTGLTQTNVCDVRVALVRRSSFD